MAKKVYLCAISNISSGGCSEDCGFCTQSARHKANIQRYVQKDISVIVAEAKNAKNNKAHGFCLVTSGKELDDKKLEFVIEACKAVKESVKDLIVIACNGIATLEQLKKLKSAGVDAYNHNLETSREFYNKICTSHNWDERLQTCKNVKNSGLSLITGGIFGMGESEVDRMELLNTIASLEPMSVPLNFFHPNDALPIKNSIDSIDEALDIIRLAREIISDSRIMIAGGRAVAFKDRQHEIFAAGADAIVVGDYLTTAGEEPKKDFEMIKKAGCEIASDC